MIPKLAALRRRRFQWHIVALTLLLLLLASVVNRLATMAISDQSSDRAPIQDETAQVAGGYQHGPPIKSLPEILAHPDIIPTHHHPLLDRQAPDFELNDLDGKAWKLSALLGDGSLVLHFYHTHCNLCVRQLFDSDKDRALFGAARAQVLAISPDAPQLTRQRFEPHGPIGFPVLCDPGNKVAEAYEVFRRTADGKRADRLLHGTFVIDRSGKIVWVNVGDAPFRRNSALLYQLAKIEGLLP